MKVYVNQLHRSGVVPMHLNFRANPELPILKTMSFRESLPIYNTILLVYNADGNFYRIASMDKIICIGKNYEDHMLELGDQPVTKPVIFLKPPSVLVQCQNWNEVIEIKLEKDEIHYECELVIKLKKGGYNISYDESEKIIDSFTIGLDMTKRKIQASLKEKGHPWTIGKVFPGSCIIGPWLDATQFNFLNMAFKFSLDMKLKQHSQGNNMIFKPSELISYVSTYFPLCDGDILFTGTPSGVGPVSKGSEGLVEIDGFAYKVKWT